MNGFDGFDLSALVQAAADDLQAPVTGDVRWVCLGQAELGGLTASDRDLIRVATGEHIPALICGDTPVSFFALQIATDRLVGCLRDGDDVPIAYLEDVYTAYEESPFGTPVCGDVLDLSLAYLAGRELALLGPDLS